MQQKMLNLDAKRQKQWIFWLNSHSNWVSTLIQQTASRHVTPLSHIILILSKPFFGFCSLMLLANSWEASNANFIVFGFIIYLTGAQAHDLPYSRQAH